MEQPVDLSDIMDFSIPDQSSLNDFNSKKKELFVMTLELGKDKHVNLTVHLDDDPELLAKAFAQQHGLDIEFTESLINIIKSNKARIQRRPNSTSPDIAKLADLLSTPTKAAVGSFDNRITLPKKYTPQIDKKSEILAKKFTKENVYDRLYRKTKKLSVPTISSSPINKIKVSTVNYGDWLYKNGLRKKEELRKSAELTKSKLENEKVIDNTYTPKINKYSSLIIPRKYENAEDLLLEKAKEYEIKISILREKAINDEVQECTFTPKIIQTQKSRSRNLEKDYLYKDALKRREKSKSMSEKSLSLSSHKQSLVKPDQPIHIRLYE